MPLNNRDVIHTTLGLISQATLMVSVADDIGMTVRHL